MATILSEVANWQPTCHIGNAPLLNISCQYITCIFSLNHCMPYWIVALHCNIEDWDIDLWYRTCECQPLEANGKVRWMMQLKINEWSQLLAHWLDIWPLDWHTLVDFKSGIRNVSIEMQDCSPLLSVRHYYALCHLPMCSGFLIRIGHWIVCWWCLFLT